MKLITKFIWIFWFYNSVAEAGILISFHRHKREAYVVKEILRAYYHYPENLIEIRAEEFPCIPNFFQVLHFCIDDQKTLRVLVKKDNVIQTAFKIFGQGWNE